MCGAVENFEVAHRTQGRDGLPRALLSMSEYDVFLADCPARTTLAVVADTWTVVVLMALGQRPHGHTEMRERIGGISSKMLTQTLRRLESNGLVGRRDLATAPRGVEY